MSRPLVLLSNDDGHASDGIRALRAALAATCDVILVAPETEQSAASHALTLHRPLRIRAVDDTTYAIDGTPADCVYIALHAGHIVPRVPDLVVSGLNHGPNLGQDVFYSGTVAAAREGALRGIPSLAASAHPKADFAAAAALAAELARALLAAAPPTQSHAPQRERGRGVLLNLNVPREWTPGRAVAYARLGQRFYDEVVDMRKDPRGRDYCWIGGPGVQHEGSPGTDTSLFHDGHATVSPLILDLGDDAGAPLVERLVGALARG